MCTQKLYNKVSDVNYLELVKLSFIIALYLVLVIFFFIFFIFLLEKSLIHLILSSIALLCCFSFCILMDFKFIIQEIRYASILLSLIFILVPVFFVLIILFSISSSRLVLSLFATTSLLLFSILIFLSKSKMENLEKLKDSYKEVANYINSSSTALVLNRAILHDLAVFVSVLEGTKLLLENSNLSAKEKRDVHEKMFISIEKIREIAQSVYSLIDGSTCYTNIQPKVEILKIVKILQNKLQYSSITVKLKDESDGVAIFGDNIIFSRIFLNIFLNAVEELEKCKKDVKEIAILLRVSKSYLIVEVTDNGNGIKDNGLKKHLSYCISSKRKYRIGSGLMFCRVLIKEKFNGRITISSQHGKYTKVSLYYRIS